MEALRVLLTNVTLASRTGSELYVRDLARRLLYLGHSPVVYTPEPGPIADELRLATVPVVDDLAALREWTPHVIHGHHTLETIQALLRFPGVPAIFVCHDSLVWHDEAPPLDRVVRHVAVDETCRDRLQFTHGVPVDRLRVIHNWVDLTRFRPRGPLPGQPERALVFSNYAEEGSHLIAVREACDRLGVPVDVIGLGAGAPTSRPEDLLPSYDLVFAKAKCALEAMAVGAAVVLCDRRGLGPMVTSSEFDRLRRLNFGARTLQGRIDPEAVLGEIKRYDPDDAALVSDQVRAEAGLDTTVDRLVELYREAIVAGAQLAPDPVNEGRVLAAFLRPISLRLRQADGSAWRLEELEAERHGLTAERHRLGVEAEQLRVQLDRAVAAAEAHADVAADAERARRELEEERQRNKALEEARQAERARYQYELDGLRKLASERAEEAEALSRELDAVSATLTFRLRARLVRLPVAGRVLRRLARLAPR